MNGTTEYSDLHTFELLLTLREAEWERDMMRRELEKAQRNLHISRKRTARVTKTRRS